MLFDLVVGELESNELKIGDKKFSVDATTLVPGSKDPSSIVSTALYDFSNAGEEKLGDPGITGDEDGDTIRAYIIAAVAIAIKQIEEGKQVSPRLFAFIDGGIRKKDHLVDTNAVGIQPQVVWAVGHMAYMLDVSSSQQTGLEMIIGVLETTAGAVVLGAKAVTQGVYVHVPAENASSGIMLGFVVPSVGGDDVQLIYDSAKDLGQPDLNTDDNFKRHVTDNVDTKITDDGVKKNLEYISPARAYRYLTSINRDFAAKYTNAVLGAFVTSTTRRVVKAIVVDVGGVDPAGNAYDPDTTTTTVPELGTGEGYTDGAKEKVKEGVIGTLLLMAARSTEASYLSHVSAHIETSEVQTPPSGPPPGSQTPRAPTPPPTSRASTPPPTSRASTPPATKPTPTNGTPPPASAGGNVGPGPAPPLVPPTTPATAPEAKPPSTGGDKVNPKPFTTERGGVHKRYGGTGDETFEVDSKTRKDVDAVESAKELLEAIIDVANKNEDQKNEVDAKALLELVKAYKSAP